MREVISRTVNLTKIEASYLGTVDGQFQKVDITHTLYVKADEKAALRELKKIYGKHNFIITKLENSSATYQMSLVDFVELAEKTN